MVTKKTAAKKVEAVEEVEEVEAVEEAPAAVAVQEEVVTPTTKRGTPNNTWTLTYGRYRIDLVEGQPTDLPLSVYNYLKSSGNLVATL